MSLISAELMEKTWQRVGAFDGREIVRLQKAHRKAQNPLTMFVYSALPDYPEEAGGVLVYVFHVVLEAFQHAQPRPKRVSKRRIEEALSELDSVDWTYTHGVEGIPTSEPHALRYVVEALTEGDDPTLTTHEIESFLQTLWIAIECLHSACRRR